MKKISITIPTWNRPKMTIESFIDVYNMEEIDEIIIVDDASEINNYLLLKEMIDNLPKVKLFRNEVNIDCYFNKKKAVELASNKWVCLWDSDNGFGIGYIKKLFEIENWDNHVAYLPCWAMPHFDYRKYEGRTIMKENVGRMAHDPTFTTMLNTANFFVNKDFYIKSWDANVNPHTADSIFMNYKMLDNGGKLYVVPGLTYLHRVDDHKNEQSGHYQANCHLTGTFHEEIIQKLKDMK